MAPQGTGKSIKYIQNDSSSSSKPKNCFLPKVGAKRPGHPSSSSKPKRRLQPNAGARRPGPKNRLLPKWVTNHLLNWLFQHRHNPYPTEEEKVRLMKETDLTLRQVNDWFTNARRRVLLDLPRTQENADRNNKSTITIRKRKKPPTTKSDMHKRSQLIDEDEFDEFYNLRLLAETAFDIKQQMEKEKEKQQQNEEVERSI